MLVSDKTLRGESMAAYLKVIEINGRLHIYEQVIYKPDGKRTREQWRLHAYVIISLHRLLYK